MSVLVVRHKLNKKPPYSIKLDLGVFINNNVVDLDLLSTQCVIKLFKFF